MEDIQRNYIDPNLIEANLLSEIIDSPVYRDAIVQRNTPPDPRRQQKMSLAKAPLTNYAFFRQSFYQVEGCLKILRTEALEAKYLVNKITGERRGTVISWSDLMFMGFTRRSVDADEKVGKMDELFSLWRNVDEILDTVESNIKRYIEALAFVDGGFGTKKEKKK
jgi:hypothetical protein